MVDILLLQNMHFTLVLLLNGADRQYRPRPGADRRQDSRGCWMKIMLLDGDWASVACPTMCWTWRALNAQGDRTLVAHQGQQVPAHLDCTGVQLLGLGMPIRPARPWNASWLEPDLVHVHLLQRQRPAGGTDRQRPGADALVP